MKKPKFEQQTIMKGDTRIVILENGINSFDNLNIMVDYGCLRQVNKNIIKKKVQRLVDILNENF